MSLSKTLFAAATTGAAFALLPTLSTAQPVQEKTMEISIADYDLDKPEDVLLVLDHIEAAAEKVCVLDQGSVSLRERLLRERCERKAVFEAVAALDSPIVMAALKETRKL